MCVVHNCTRLKVSDNSPPTVKKKDFVSKAIRLGVSLHGATSKRDSMWHSPVFTCIRANRIPVEIYNKLGMNYIVVWMQNLCLVFLFLVWRLCLWISFVIHLSEHQSSQILFVTAIVFVRDKYRQLVKCWGLLDSAWKYYILEKFSSTASFENIQGTCTSSWHFRGHKNN